MGDGREENLQTSDDFSGELRFIEIYTKKRILAHLLGEYESSIVGTGLEFFEHKKYQRGDDYRRIDWNVTARSQYPYVKRFLADKEINVWLVGDLSSSMFFGSKARSKSEVMIQIVAVLGFSASYLNMKVGFLGFSDEVELLVTPKRSRAVTWEILRLIPRSRADRRSTKFQAVVETLYGNVRGTSMIFFLSDLIDLEDMFENPQVKHLIQHHDFIPVVIEDPFERTIPKIPGLQCVRDSESGHRIMFYWSRENRRRYAQGMEQRREALITSFYRMNLDFLWIDIDSEDIVDRLVEFFIRRKTLL